MQGACSSARCRTATSSSSGLGSALLHTPELLLGGEPTFLLSRSIFWLQIGVIAWSWIVITRVRDTTPAALLGTTAFALGAHNFPSMAWYTVDGLFLGSGGKVLIARVRAARRLRARRNGGDLPAELRRAPAGGVVRLRRLAALAQLAGDGCRAALRVIPGEEADRVAALEPTGEDVSWA